MLDSELFIKSFYIDWDKIDENSYLRDIEAIRDISHKPFDKSVTFFVGENGTGKSTLLEALAVAYGFNPEGGTRNYSFYQRGCLWKTSLSYEKRTWSVCDYRYERA